MEEHNYVVFGLKKGKTTGEVSIMIQTSITNPSVARDMVTHMNNLFPLYDWDCSNAEWTRK